MVDKSYTSVSINIKNLLMPIRSSILIAFLFASQTILAQSTNVEQADEAVMYKKFNQWVNDTIPTITDQYSLQYDENMQCEELDITIVFNAEVKDGKMTSHSNTSTSLAHAYMSLMR